MRSLPAIWGARRSQARRCFGHPGSVLKVSFVRRRGSRDRVYVTRGDGSSTGWDFPSYGDGLPHDLCHLVVEDELGLTEGFWGLVDQGVDVGLVNNQATLMRQGEPLVEHVSIDFSGLNEAEAAVAILACATVDVDRLRRARRGPTRYPERRDGGDR